MKKKFLSIFGAIALVVCTGFTMAGCSFGEVEEGTKTVIETTTNVLPYEFSAETAKGIAIRAYNDLVLSERVQITTTEKESDSGALYTTNKNIQVVLNENPYGTIVYTKNELENILRERIAIKEGKQITLYDLDLNTKKVSTTNSMNSYTHLEDYIKNIDSGYYYNGEMHLFGSVLEEDCISSQEIIIENGKIVKVINTDSYQIFDNSISDKSSLTSIVEEFKYGDDVTVPTDLVKVTNRNQFENYGYHFN